MTNVEDGWKLLLPVVAAICATAQEDFDAKQAVFEAAEILDECQDYLTDLDKPEKKRG